MIDSKDLIDDSFDAVEPVECPSFVFEMTALSKLDNRREIELAEGVHIHLRPAGIFPRMLARMIDMTIWMAVYLVAMVVFALTGAVVGGEVSQGFSLVGDLYHGVVL